MHDFDMKEKRLPSNSKQGLVSFKNRVLERVYSSLLNMSIRGHVLEKEEQAFLYQDKKLLICMNVIGI